MNRRASAVLLFAATGLILLSSFVSRSTRAQDPHGGNADSPPDREEEGDDIRGREDWFYRQRRYPLGAIPAGARQRALERKQEMRRALQEQSNRGLALNGRSLVVSQLLASSTAWAPIGPAPTLASDPGVGMVSGRVSAIAVDPTNPSIVYVGGAQGGVWKSTDGGAHWSPTFDTEKTLAIGSIAIDPSSCIPGPCTILYVGTGEQNFSGDSYYGAGIYKSIDGGTTWTQIPLETITNPQPGAAGSFLSAPFNQAVGGVRISSLVVHPTNPTKLFAGVQIFINFDGGASSGLYCSDDAGQTWTQVLHGAVGTDIQIHPANIGGAVGSVGYAALGSLNGDNFVPSPDPTGQNGVFKTAQAHTACTNQAPGQPGAWASVGSAPLPTGTNAGVIRLGVAPSDATANTVYAAVGVPVTPANPNDNLAGVFRTTNGGNAWTPITPPVDFCGHLPPKNDGQCSYDLVVKVHPNDANTVFVGGSRATSGNAPYFLLRTINGGTTWQSIATDGVTTLHVDQHALAFGFTGANVTSVFVGNDGGIWSSALPTSSSPVSWTNLNQTLQLSQFYAGMSFDPATANFSLGGTQDNGTQEYDPGSNPGNAQLWTEQAVCGDGGYTAIDPANPMTVYAACQKINVNKSTDRGATFASARAGINQNDRSEFIPPLVIDPNPAASNRLYFGTFRVYQTLDGAATWNAISQDLTLDPMNSADLTSLSVSPVNSAVVYAGTFPAQGANSRVWRTTNANAGPPTQTSAGATWTEIDGGMLPPRAITQVLADPNNQDVVFVTTSGFSGFMINPPATDTQGHVFRCSATQSTCLDISGAGMGALPNVPVNAIVVDPIFVNSNTLYIGTDVGVFASTDGGATWQPDFPATPPAFNGLPNVAVLSLTLQPVARILRAGTHGRGAWDLQLGDFFTLNANPTSGSAARGSAGSTTLSLAPVPSGGMYPGTVNFSCSGLPTETTCTFTPASLAQNAGAANVTLAIKTTAPSLVAPRTRGPWRQFRPAPFSEVAVWLGLVMAASAALAVARRLPTAAGPRPAWTRYAAAVLLLLALAGLAVACGGGGSSSSGGGGTRDPGTSLGTYPIMVTATSGNITHSVTFTLTVQ